MNDPLMELAERVRSVCLEKVKPLMSTLGINGDGIDLAPIVKAFRESLPKDWEKELANALDNYSDEVDKTAISVLILRDAETEARNKIFRLVRNLLATQQRVPECAYKDWEEEFDNLLADAMLAYYNGRTSMLESNEEFRQAFDALHDFVRKLAAPSPEKE